MNLDNTHIYDYWNQATIYYIFRNWVINNNNDKTQILLISKFIIYGS